MRSRRPEPVGPEPFTSEWIESPPPAPLPRSGLPSWMPSERALTAALVLILVLGTALIGTSGGAAHIGAPPTPTPLRMAADVSTPQSTGAGSTPATALAPIVIAPSATAAATASPTAPAVAHAATTVAASGQATATDPNALLPKYRILSFYGFPGDEHMGILGVYDKDTLYQKLQEQAAAYQQADPKRPIKLAFEVIASVAQSYPGSDNTYVAHAGKSILDSYADFTAQHDMLLILDVQVGRSTVANEIEFLRPWLERPNVELAIDPEFAFSGSDQAPGQNIIGGVNASDITDAQHTLAQLSADKGIPPKILIVHQFVEKMIRDRDQLAPVPGVQLVIDMDGFGSPDDKTKPYNQFVADAPIQFGGIKLFYKNDDPLMTPEQVLQLNPAPDVVIYQ